MPLASKAMSCEDARINALHEEPIGLQVTLSLAPSPPCSASRLTAQKDMGMELILLGMPTLSRAGCCMM